MGSACVQDSSELLVLCLVSCFLYVIVLIVVLRAQFWSPVHFDSVLKHTFNEWLILYILKNFVIFGFIYMCIS